MGNIIYNMAFKISVNQLNVMIWPQKYTMNWIILYRIVAKYMQKLQEQAERKRQAEGMISQLEREERQLLQTPAFWSNSMQEQVQ